MPREHGCQSPWRPAQVASLLVWFTTVAGFYALEVPMLPSVAWQAATAVLYSLATVVVFCAYFKVSLTNPSDDSADGPLYCETCKAFVQRGSRHCKECQKCVLGFDHHCKWVKNCIGTKNYRSFLTLLTATCTMLAVQLTAGIFDLVRCFTAAVAVSTQLQEAYPIPISRPGYVAALCSYITVVSVALYGLGDLWLLHLVLIARGLTTYDYIMANHDAAVAAAAGGAGAGAAGSTAAAESPSASVLAASWLRLRSLGPRSTRVQDESGLSAPATFGDGTKGPLLPVAAAGCPPVPPCSSSSSSNTGRGLRVATFKKHRVSLTPCQACMTPQSVIDARQHAVAYKQQLSSNSTASSPRGMFQQPAAAAKQGAAAFDAASSSRRSTQEQAQAASVQWPSLQQPQQQQQQSQLPQIVVTGALPSAEQPAQRLRTRTNTVSWGGDTQQQQQQQVVEVVVMQAAPDAAQAAQHTRTVSWDDKQQQQQQQSADWSAPAVQTGSSTAVQQSALADARKPSVRFAAEL